MHPTNVISSCGAFYKWWYPQIIHFNRMFPYKSSIVGYLHLRKPPCGSMFFVPLLFSMVSGRCFLYVLGEGIWIRHIIVSHLGRSTSSPVGILMVYHSQSWLGTLTSVLRECSWDRIRTHNGMALGSSWDITITKQ